VSGLYTVAGALIIGGGMAITGKNPYSAKDVKGAIGIQSPLSPGAPPVMPDQTSVLQAQQLQESKSAAVQYGRAATVLTGTGAAGASSTGDRLGP
jgi:hypothetical protein